MGYATRPMLTSSCLLCSSISRSHQTLHSLPSGGAAARNEDRIQPEIDVDQLNTARLFGHESDATVWYRVFRYFGSSILAADDVGE